MHLTQAIQRNAQTKGGHTALQCGELSRTWSEVEGRVARLAGALQSRGVEPGERVAMLALNSDRYYEYYYAVPWAGAVLVPLNIRWSVKENLYSLNDSGATVLFVDDMFQDVGQQLFELSDTLKLVIYTGDGETPQGMLNYEQLIAEAEPVSASECDTGEMAGIFYTGGTTGFPKGVMLSHQNIWTSTFSAMVDFDLHRRADAVVLHAAPMFHLACGTMLWSSTIGGVTQTFVPAFESGRVLKIIEQERVTDTLLVPTMVSMLLASDALAGCDVSSLKQVVYGASPMPEGTLLEAMEKMPSVGFCQAYGQTELSPIATILAPEYHVLEGPKAGKIRAAGRAGYCVTLEIRAADGKALPAGTVGEVAVKGPNTMMGYWNNPEQTAKTLIDGWVMTGDAGYLDDDGFLFLVDRIKDMIVTGGENVFSAEVESAVSKHPAVHEVVVIGIPSEQWGESVHAIVRLKPGESVEEVDIVNFCREEIAGYKVPRSVEFRQEPFPITGAGKLRKNSLRDPYWEGKDRKIN
ncbi:MAG: long-chain-fatty-acid--CoA ligase [Motiliproteus sp.]